MAELQKAQFDALHAAERLAAKRERDAVRRQDHAGAAAWDALRRRYLDRVTLHLERDLGA